MFSTVLTLPSWLLRRVLVLLANLDLIGMAICLLFISFVILRLNQWAVVSHSLQQHQQQPQPSNECSDKCGSFQIPFPFYLNTTCGSNTPPISDAFRLSCQNSTSLFLNIASKTYPILQFFPDGVLVGFPNTTTTPSSTCGGGGRRPYNDLNAFGFEGNDYFGISTDNVVGLYDCEDSSLCKVDCMFMNAPGCDIHGYPACCYPLSDGSSWRMGEGFSVFYQFGCRGFSCWVGTGTGSNNNNNNITGKRGVKLEWAVPKNSSQAQCAPNAYSVHATSLTSGVRCQCLLGFVGDGFALGLGCHKSCLKDGREVYGKDCFMKGHNRRKVEILAGVLASAVSIASLIALFCQLKRPSKSNAFDHTDQGHIQGAISFQKACKTQYFSYHELEKATKGFDEGQKVVDGTKGTLYAGVIGDGSSVAVNKVPCESERDLIQVLSLVENLSAVPHQNLARLLGCCTDTGCTPLVVYEYPANGTLAEHLHRSRGQKTGLDWCKRLNIASEIAGVLSFLQYEISPPILHQNLQSGCIFLNEDFSVKIAGFVQLSANLEDGSNSYNNSASSHLCRTDVYSLGVVLLEIITGARPLDLPTTALQKIRSGKLEEIVDPILYYHEQLPFCREQMEIVADLATRCLLFGGDHGKLGMMDVARELMHIKKECVDGRRRRGPALEETFSNSSLLQMISMSPDSIHVP